MMKNTIFLLLVIFGLFACEDDDSVFEPSTEGLEIKFTGYRTIATSLP